LLFVGAFIGILAYAIISGDPKDALAVHNVNGKACYKQSGFVSKSWCYFRWLLYKCRL